MLCEGRANGQSAKKPGLLANVASSLVSMPTHRGTVNTAYQIVSEPVKKPSPGYGVRCLWSQSRGGVSALSAGRSRAAAPRGTKTAIG